MPELTDKQIQARQPAQLHVLPIKPTPPSTSATTPVRGLPDYAELHCLTNFSFQRGASRPEELVTQAYHLGYQALAITDECSVAGIVRAHVALREHPEAMDEWERKHPDQPKITRNPGFRLLFGSEFRFDRFTLVVIAHDLEGWGNLCEFITAARNTDAPKGEYQVSWHGSDVASLQHCEILWVPHRPPGGAMDVASMCADVAAARALYGDHLWIAVELLNERDDDV
jgi:error-prone DNA polymerase